MFKKKITLLLSLLGLLSVVGLMSDLKFRTRATLRYNMTLVSVLALFTSMGICLEKCQFGFSKSSEFKIVVIIILLLMTF